MTLAKPLAKRKSSKQNRQIAEDEVGLGTPEEIARDNAEWDAIIAKTTPEKLDMLERMFADEVKRGGILPLDFTNK